MHPKLKTLNLALPCAVPKMLPLKVDIAFDRRAEIDDQQAGLSGGKDASPP